MEFVIDRPTLTSHSRAFLIGIDCGGTHTAAALVSTDGHFVSVGRGGPANLRNNSEAQVATSIEDAVADAYTHGSAPLSPADCQGLAIGFAGISTGEDIGYRILKSLNLAPPERTVLTHDIRIAWAGAFGLKPGIVVIAGTGSAAFGVDSTGREARAGGLGASHDRGSAFWIVCEALAAIFPGDRMCAMAGSSQFLLCRAPNDDAKPFDSIAPSQILVDGMLRHFKAGNITELRDDLAAEGQSVRTIAAAAPNVVTAAQNGDAVARRIMAFAFGDLAHLILTVQSQLDVRPGELPVCVVGGLAASIPLFPREFRDRLFTVAGADRVSQPLLAPHFGAVLLAAHRVAPGLGERFAGELVSSVRAIQARAIN